MNPCVTEKWNDPPVLGWENFHEFSAQNSHDIYIQHRVWLESAKTSQAVNFLFTLSCQSFPQILLQKSQLSGLSTQKLPFSHDFSKQAPDRLQWCDVPHKELFHHTLNARKIFLHETDEPWGAVSSVACDGLQRWLGCLSAVGHVDFGPIQQAPQLGQLHPSVAAGSRASRQLVHRPPVLCQEGWERQVSTAKLTAGRQLQRRELKMFSRMKYRDSVKRSYQTLQGTWFKPPTAFGATNPVSQFFAA